MDAADTLTDLTLTFKSFFIIKYSWFSILSSGISLGYSTGFESLLLIEFIFKIYFI